MRSCFEPRCARADGDAEIATPMDATKSRRLMSTSRASGPCSHRAVKHERVGLRHTAILLQLIILAEHDRREIYAERLRRDEALPRTPMAGIAARCCAHGAADHAA